MTEVWKQCEGQVVDEKFCLRQYLSDRERSAVFLTERGDRERQIVAIKLVLTDPEEADTQLARWERVAKLSHPHLMRLFVGGRCYLRDLRLLYVVMENADQDLSHVLPDRPLTAEETREMLEPAVSAPAYVHGEGFVHGHLKPANIMAVDDQLKVSSDGLLPAGESIRGTVKPGVYDPPEIAGEGISPAGDVWSLGVTVVEALTQRSSGLEWNRTDRSRPAGDTAGSVCRHSASLSASGPSAPVDSWGHSSAPAADLHPSAGTQERQSTRSLPAASCFTGSGTRFGTGWDTGSSGVAQSPAGVSRRFTRAVG